MSCVMWWLAILNINLSFIREFEVNFDDEFIIIVFNVNMNLTIYMSYYMKMAILQNLFLKKFQMIRDSGNKPISIFDLGK